MIAATKKTVPTWKAVAQRLRMAAAELTAAAKQLEKERPTR